MEDKKEMSIGLPLQGEAGTPDSEEPAPPTTFRPLPTAGFPAGPATQPESRPAPGESCGCGNPAEDPDQPCCGPRQMPPSSPHERPGYRIWSFVEGFTETPAGTVPRIKTEWTKSDWLGTIGARSGIRNHYKVAPGLYAAGNPDADSPVLVTANYKLTFDAVRRELFGLDAWLLVLDTRGINVWCAAGKKTFGTEELIRWVKAVNLDRVVRHRELILPQLGAPGVAAHEISRGCGFKVVWGPIQARDIPRFLADGKEATPKMRRVTFTTRERAVLTPVEISMLWKPFLYALAVILILSGIGPGVFSPIAAVNRGLMAVWALVMGVLAGAAAGPILLPWLPSVRFYVKGAAVGLVGGLILVFSNLSGPNWLEDIALTLLTVSLSSYLTMNFTGSTPYTSLSGVEKEMRQAIPLQALAIFLAAVAWVAGAFMA